ncbi:aminotransferase class I/II-fold pyridoxal phosphate-dependent enzyme [Octadecabacter sp. 1_MG-2023]|uniref:trans-sulfuration enzyme family protein n=1 Tax=unclassified Octadecabacter TaxID=196158 RepID=UPI001C08AFA1|nr:MULTISPECIES: aminotransferase class I/II-fold pyridoxal phosphate-dependent enzyme [unclassified Octadecabacter]MBU2993293.1 aminotransferase class I/II-fold pyridoxal phosphate-dependent enzyme [Octadecabacter sp. B2R22]MDO6733251.1 aminotransferase class I/II-fold pyridoxal phosphate-dependent enzyme [Octadecabacter sp. 1_MG-2023]
MAETPKSLARRPEWPSSVSRPVATPLQPSVVYSSPDPTALDKQYAEGTGYTYAREGHPNATVLAQKIDMLEGVEGGIVNGSGMAAVSTVLFGLLKSGDHVIGADQLYGRTLRLMTQDLPRFGIETTLADPTDAASFEAAIRPNTRMMIVEVVSNPTIRIADMEGIAKIANERGILLMVDNTFTTPRGYRPFDHGADIVVHSVTKLLAGHADATLGYAVAKDPALNEAIYIANTTFGMTASPFDCWLAERGLQTFEIRYDRAEATATTLAEALADVKGVKRVFHPSRNDHPDHNRALQILGNRPGNMLSIEIEGGRAAADAMTRAAPELPFAPTLGDVGTTLSHPASSSHRALTPEARADLGISEGFFRISVGLEDPDMLIAEFTKAITESQKV